MTDQYAEQLADAAEILDTLTSKLPADHPVRLAAEARAKQAVPNLYGLAEAVPGLLAERDRLRDALRPLAEVDLSQQPPNDFPWFVLKARAALAQEQGEPK